MKFKSKKRKLILLWAIPLSGMVLISGIVLAVVFSQKFNLGKTDIKQSIPGGDKGKPDSRENLEEPISDNAAEKNKTENFNNTNDIDSNNPLPPAPNPDSFNSEISESKPSNNDQIINNSNHNETPDIDENNNKNDYEIKNGEKVDSSIEQPTDSKISEEKIKVKYQIYNNDVYKRPGFSNNKFRLQKSITNVYKKYYRMNNLLSRMSWNFNEKKQEFNWEFSLDEIDNILKMDDTSLEPYLYLLLNFRKRKIDESNTKEPTEKSIIYENYPIGIRFSLEEIREKKFLVVDKIDDILLVIQYHNSSNSLSFSISKKPDTKKILTDNIYDAEANDKIFFSYFTSFVNLGFTSKNGENQTLEKFKLYEQYKDFNFVDFLNTNKSLIPKKRFIDRAFLFNPEKPFDVNVNSNDASTQENITYENISEKKFINTYSPVISQIYSYNDFPLAEDIRIRTFYFAGTWTMFAKVKPSDPNDERYYVMSNRHVGEAIEKYAKEGIYYEFKKIGNSYFKNTMNVNFWEGIDKIRENPSKFEIPNFWIINKDQQKNKQGQDSRYGVDIQVNIIDLKQLKPLIKEKIRLNHSVENWTSVLQDFEKWPTLPPLKFTNKYTNLTRSEKNNNLFGFYMNGYGAGGYNSQIINKMNYVFRGGSAETLTFQINHNEEFSTLVRGNSGSLLIDEEKNVVAIYAFSSPAGQNIINEYAYMLNSPILDVIGANYGKYDPAKNINPATLCHKIIQAAKNDPDNFEIIDICMPINE
ncbi:hypothetical protein ACW95P_04790 [Candidatus Mycoplasma pogonae]